MVANWLGVDLRCPNRPWMAKKKMYWQAMGQNPSTYCTMLYYIVSLRCKIFGCQVTLHDRVSPE